MNEYLVTSILIIFLELSCSRLSIASYHANYRVSSLLSPILILLLMPKFPILFLGRIIINMLFNLILYHLPTCCRKDPNVRTILPKLLQLLILGLLISVFEIEFSLLQIVPDLQVFHWFELFKFRFIFLANITSNG